ncbi:MAG: hypothetical protein ABFD66_00455 [Smithella sp.]
MQVLKTIEIDGQKYDVVIEEGGKYSPCNRCALSRDECESLPCGEEADAYLVKHLPCTGAKRCPQADDVTCEECEKECGE